MADFLHMGGYAFFVWTSYAIVAASMLYVFLSPIIRHRQLKRELENTLPKRDK